MFVCASVCVCESVCLSRWGRGLTYPTISASAHAGSNSAFAVWVEFNLIKSVAIRTGRSWTPSPQLLPCPPSRPQGAHLDCFFLPPCVIERNDALSERKASCIYSLCSSVLCFTLTALRRILNKNFLLRRSSFIIIWLLLQVVVGGFFLFFIFLFFYFCQILTYRFACNDLLC